MPTMLTPRPLSFFKPFQLIVNCLLTETLYLVRRAAQRSRSRVRRGRFVRMRRRDRARALVTRPVLAGPILVTRKRLFRRKSLELIY